MRRLTRLVLVATLAAAAVGIPAAPAQAQVDIPLEQRVVILCSADMFRAHLEAVDVIENAAVIAIQVLGLVADAGADEAGLEATGERVSFAVAEYTEIATAFIDRIASDCIAFLAALEANPAFAEQVRTVQLQVIALVRGANETAQVEIEAELRRLLDGLP